MTKKEMRKKENQLVELLNELEGVNFFEISPQIRIHREIAEINIDGEFDDFLIEHNYKPCYY